MFLEFYGLREDPFSNNIPRSLYLGVGHRKALASLYYGIEYGGGIPLLLADSGLGKTALLRHLTERVQTYARAVLLSSTDFEESESLRSLLSDLKPDGSDRVLGLYKKNVDEFRTSQREAERRLILLVDNAEKLKDEALASIRLLAKLEAFESGRLRIILAGRIEPLQTITHSDPLDTFQQIRIAPLSPAETFEYISHRMRMAGGGQGSIFTPAACALVGQRSEGIPRSINEICWKALVAGAKHQLKQIDESIVGNENVDHQIDIAVRRPEPSSWSRIPLGARLLTVLSLAVVVSGFWYKHNLGVLRSLRIAVSEISPLPNASSSEAPQIAPLESSGINSSKVEGSPRTQSNKTIAPHELKRFSNASSVAYGRWIAIVPVAGQILRRSASKDPGSETASGAIAAPAVPVPFQRAAERGLPSSVLQDNQAPQHSDQSSSLSNALTAAEAHRISVQTDVGDDYMRLGQYDKAIDFYQDALAQTPRSEELRRRITRARRAKATEAQILVR
jgi:general secretion pathway protein A